MTMATKSFDLIAKQEFSFLESEYGFKLLKCNKEDWSYELIYVNDSTEVKITYKYREAYILVVLYKLVEGDLQENPRNVEDSTVLYGYGLDDILMLCNLDSLIKPAYEYGE